MYFISICLIIVLFLLLCVECINIKSRYLRYESVKVWIMFNWPFSAAKQEQTDFSVWKGEFQWDVACYIIYSEFIYTHTK